MNPNLQTVLTKAQDSLNTDLMIFEGLKYKAHDPNIHEFLGKILEWRVKDNILEWMMFSEVLDSDSLKDWLSSLNFFLGNTLMGNCCFSIEWRKVHYKNNQVQLGKSGEVEMILTTKEDPKARPVVVNCKFGYPGFSQDPKLLLEAMEILVEREK